MKILVTGGAGYVGSNLVKHLQRHTNATITSLDNYFTGQEANHIKGVEYIQDCTWKINELPKQDIVYHFGEYSRVVPSFKDIEYLKLSSFPIHPFFPPRLVFLTSRGYFTRCGISSIYFFIKFLYSIFAFFTFSRSCL